MSTRRNTPVRWLWACLIAGVASVHLSAHDLERTTVHLRLSADGSFALRVAHDPSWLLLRMETFTGGSTVSPNDPAARDARLRALAPHIIDRVVLFIDGHEVRPASAEYAPPPASVPDGELALAAYTMRGRLPQRAHTLRWYYGMVADPYPFTVELSDGSSKTESVLGDAWSTALTLDHPFAPPPTLTRLRESIAAGYAHVVPNGIDHILFVAGLFLLGTGALSVLAQATIFTIAQAIGLALSLYGLWSLPVRFVDPLMGLSIAYVAVETLRVRTSTATVTTLVSLIGLVHGLGSANMPGPLDPTRQASAIPLIGFNAGIELGQVSVIVGAALLLGGWRRHAWYYSRVVVPASIVIATAGTLWTMMRVSGWH